MSNILFPYAHLVGKRFFHPRKYSDTKSYGSEPVELVVVAVENGATDYLKVAKESDRENTWSMWAVEVEPLVLLYDLYYAAESILDNLVDADEHLHPTHGYVLTDIHYIWRQLNKTDTWLNGGQFEPLVDQYDNRVPDDLIAMPDVKKAFEMVDSGHDDYIVTNYMDWYEAEGVGLLVPLHQVPPNYQQFFDTGFVLELDDNSKVSFVSESLRRYNTKDGFYHA